MRFLLSLLGIGIPSARAATIEQLGSDAPGISEMFGDLKSLFPHTDAGSGGLAFVLLMITNLVLRFIGAVAVLMIVYGGIRMIMTIADENAQSEAKKIVLYACLGLIFAIVSDAVVVYVMSLVQAAAGG